MLGRTTLFLLGLACLLQSAAGFAVAGGQRLSLARPHAARPRVESTVHMKSQEDKEFEEWVRQKKIASGVDPDEDFAGGREVEGGIYLVGGKFEHPTTSRAPARPSALPTTCPAMPDLSSHLLSVCTGLITVLVPVIAGTWAYNAGYLTPQ